MNAWAYIEAAYAITIGGTALLFATSYVRYRRATRGYDVSSSDP